LVTHRSNHLAHLLRRSNHFAHYSRTFHHFADDFIEDLMVWDTLFHVVARNVIRTGPMTEPVNPKNVKQDWKKKQATKNYIKYSNFEKKHIYIYIYIYIYIFMCIHINPNHLYTNMQSFSFI
jgi:hypothetical protein